MPIRCTLRPTMTHRFITALSRILWDTDLLASRFTLALAELLWGILLLLPGSTFERAYYHNMASVAGEDMWGLIFIATAITQFSIVLHGDLHNRFARIFAGWNMTLWVTTIGSLLLIYPPSAALAGEISLVCAATWIFVRPYILAEGYKRAK